MVFESLEIVTDPSLTYCLLEFSSPFENKFLFPESTKICQNEVGGE